VTDLTEAEISNGWTAESLAAYRRDRDKVADVVPGNIVTEFKRPKAGIVMQGAKGFDPHRW
jgi:hypothetical protein